MKIKPKQYALALLESIDGKKENEIKGIVGEFARVLVNNNHTSQLERIIDYFGILYNRQRGIVEADIISAHKIPSRTINELKSCVLGWSGSSKAEVRQHLDPGLLGGVVVKYSDRIIDHSLRSRVDSFRRAMRQ